MSTLFGAGSGKSRGTTGLSGNALDLVERRVAPVGANRDLTSEFMRQLSEALRTGGIGAQIPIIQQAVSGANQATSQALRGTEASLASSGLAGTPYGQRTLAETRMSGAQQAARIPTDYAQQFIGGIPQFTQGLLGQVLGAIRKQQTASGPYNT